MSEKSPFYAYFFSIILPGLGQIYLNHKKRGLTILIGALALSITLAFLFALSVAYYNEYDFCRDFASMNTS
jgi:TM2 domain-containing membrane protein YozV